MTTPRTQRGRKTVPLTDVRRLVADYIGSEGCSCCEDASHKEEHLPALAKALGVPMYHDKSGYNFPRFKTKKAILPLRKRGKR